MVPVDPSDANSIDELMKHAAKLRSTAATNMNAHSSRSHSIFTLHLTATHIAQGLTLHGQLNLVDLAGSERVEKSGVTGQALTEAKAINVSLSALAGVFQAISKGNSHVRNLTPHILYSFDVHHHAAVQPYLSSVLHAFFFSLVVCSDPLPRLEIDGALTPSTQWQRQNSHDAQPLAP